MPMVKGAKLLYRHIWAELWMSIAPVLLLGQWYLSVCDVWSRAW